MQRAIRIALVAAILEAIAIVLLLLGPDSLRWLVIPVLVVGLAVQALVFIRGIRADREALRRIIASHPGATVRPTRLTGDPGLARADRARVLAVIADRAGLSFRDHDDAEVMLVPAAGILSLELGPAGSRIRPAIVTRLDGPPVEFFAGAGEDQLLATVVALREALGRPVG